MAPRSAAANPQAVATPSEPQAAVAPQTAQPASQDGVFQEFTGQAEHNRPLTRLANAKEIKAGTRAADRAASQELRAAQWEDLTRKPAELVQRGRQVVGEHVEKVKGLFSDAADYVKDRTNAAGEFIGDAKDAVVEYGGKVGNAGRNLGRAVIGRDPVISGPEPVPQSVGSAARGAWSAEQEVALYSKDGAAEYINKLDEVDGVKITPFAKQHLIENLPDTPLHEDAIKLAAKDIVEQKGTYAEWNGTHGNFAGQNTKELLSSKTTEFVEAEKTLQSSTLSSPTASVAEKTVVAAEKASAWYKPWTWGGKAAGTATADALEEGAVSSGAKVAVGETIAETAGVGIVGGVARGVLGGLGGIVPGAWELGKGIHDGNAREKKTGVLSMVVGGAGAFAFGTLGTFVAGPVGTAVGAGIGGWLGDWAAKKAAGALWGAEDAVKETADQLKAQWQGKFSDYRDKMKAALNGGEGQLGDLAKQAQDSGKALMEHLQKLEACHAITHDEFLKQCGNAQADWENFKKQAQEKFGGAGHPAASGGTEHHAAVGGGGVSRHHDECLKDTVTKMQQMMGFKDPADAKPGDDVADGLLGHKTVNKLLELGIVKDASEIHLGSSSRSAASDQDIANFIKNHHEELDKYLAACQVEKDKQQPAPEAPQPPAPDRPAAPASAQPPSRPAAPSAPAIDDQLLAALRSLNATDVQQMQPDGGRTHEVGINVLAGDGQFNIGHEFNDKKLPYIDVKNGGEPGQIPYAATIDVATQRVTAANGTDLTDKTTNLSEVISQAQKEHISKIEIQEVNSPHNDSHLTTFVFAPLTPSVDKGEQVAQKQ